MAIFNGFNEFKIGLRAAVLADPTVTGLIGTRFFSAQLATFFTEGTDFPLATFHPLEGPDRIFWRRFNIRLQAWSNKSYDESHDIFAAIRDILFCANIKPKSVIHTFGGVLENYEESSRLYSVSGSFSVTQVL